MSVEDVDAFLAHHGILGMKWGVRKRELASSQKPSEEKKKLTDKQKKILIAAGITVGAGVIAVGSILAAKGIRELAVNKLADEAFESVKDSPSFRETANKGKEFFDELRSKDTFIPKGVDFHRVASELESGINSPKYATYIDKDIFRYRKSWTPISSVMGNGNTSKSFKTVFDTLHNTRIASRSSMTELGKELFNSSKIPGSKGFKEAVLKELGPWAAGKKLSSDEAMNWWLDSNRGGAWKSPAATQLFNYLSRNGYGGITDEIDTGLIANHAVVLINNSMFKATGSPLTDLERKAARKLFDKAFKV